MKIRTLLAPIVVGLIAQVVTANAADWFAVNVRGTCRSINDADKIGRTAFNNNTIIQDYLATQEEPPLARHLKLAYDPEADKISIVNTNGEAVLDVFSFGFPTVVSNSLETQRERHVFLFPPGGSDAVGTAQIVERLTRDGEGVLTKLSARGNMQYSTAATEETPAEVCSGTFTTGRKLTFFTPEPAPVE
jgi:hypothetical protein